ncbi:cell division septum initiation protein DivIVA [Clostridium algifaecis]|mgnify:CR=1 FL=1|uniref:Cell division septum initiation protein DivIVA n=1 Tax=Clostridium algifaecis TaxID=1472040 RepID=A0ABS4KNK5_9CLOT|nr:ATPase [Clostridium algifaecis]MBP2031621.1 cell division septum initiation protein DivIVA [Clostridium algifaecis]
METMKLLEYLEEIIETSAKVPMTGKVMVSKKEILEVISKIVNCLPGELKKAQWVVDEKERILNEAISEAESMKKENLSILRRQIENHDITREADKRAAEIISSAKKNAKAIRMGARDYADDILHQLDMEIERKSKQMISDLKVQLQQFVDDLEGGIHLNTDSIKENINELRNMK